ncbi:MAG: polysaccharide biosynthesis tyrosine autokinase [Chloroflexota bacterium]|nr:polysaccharide biosynthesis tyrosine autokinase [Chloroflexota bacterium]
MDLRPQGSILRHRIGFILAGTLLAAAAAFIVSAALPKTYQASASLIVGQTASVATPDQNAPATSQRLSQTYADLATTGPVLQKVIDKLQLGTGVEELRGRISVVAPQGSAVLRIIASDGSASRAAAIANQIADELIASAAIPPRAPDVQTFIDEQLRQLQSQIQATQAEVSRLASLPARSSSQEQDLQLARNRLLAQQSTYASLLASSPASTAQPLSLVDSALAPAEPVGPQPLLYAILAAMVALVVGIVLALVIERLDDTIKSADQVEASLGLPTLGGISRMNGDPKQSEIFHLVTVVDPGSPVADSYRALRMNTDFAMVGAPARTLLVTSSVPGEGKTTTAANLAAAFAQAGRRTLLLDADLRKPGIHRIFDLPNAYGLFTLLRSDDTAFEQLVHTTEQSGLSVMTSGPLPPNPAELLASERFKGILQRLRVAYDLVVIDSPSLEGVTDAAILASATDATILVVRAGRTRREAAVNGRDALAREGARVLGAVMNRLRDRVRQQDFDRSQAAHALDREEAPIAPNPGSVVAASGSHRR